MICKKVSNLMVAVDLTLGPTAKNNSSKITHSIKKVPLI